jgi:hypothetical protein
MRVLVLALAILLLPLRGWLGDAMAIGMVQQHVAAQALAAHGAHDAHGVQSRHTAHADHAMHDTAATTHEVGDDGGLAHAHGATTTGPCDGQTTCSSCQLCHSVAVTVWPEVPLLGKAPCAAPAFEPIAFASTEPAPGFKPPIS